MRLNRLPALTLAIVLITAASALLLHKRDASADLMGDANCDGTVNSIDGAVILQSAAGFSIDFGCLAKVDVTGEGRIDSIDAALVLQYTAGLIDDLDLSPTVTATRTRTPAATRTRTATPTSTHTATSIPTASNGSMSIRHSTWHMDSTGGLLAVGEVYNGLDHEAELIEVTASLYSASNTLLGTATGHACVTTVATEADSAFTVHVFSQPEAPDHVSLKVTHYFEPPGLFYPVVTGLDASITDVYTDSRGRLHVEGIVTNNSVNTYEYVHPCVAYYNAAGDVARVDLAFTAPRTLRSGDEGTFESVVVADGVGIVSQRVWVNAQYR